MATRAAAYIAGTEQVGTGEGGEAELPPPTSVTAQRASPLCDNRIKIASLNTQAFDLTTYSFN